MEKFKNRQEAGKLLAQSLRAYANRDHVLVLALPRGGVPVGFEIANALNVPLDVFVVRKLGVPGHSELAMGAIAMDQTIFNEDIVRNLHISKEDIQQVIASELQELKRRELAYRGHQTYPSLKDKIIILVDDGIATGASMHVAIQALKHLQPQKMIVAVPVAAKDTCEEIAPLVDEFYCPLRPLHFYAVGAWYDDFSQTEDEEVYSLLNKASKLQTNENT